MLGKIGLGPGAPRRGPFSFPNRFQIICFPSFLRRFLCLIIRKYLKNGAASGTEWSETTREKFGKLLCLSGIFQVPLHKSNALSFSRQGVLLYGCRGGHWPPAGASRWPQAPAGRRGRRPLQALWQHRIIPALRLKHRSGGCGTASALPKCSIRHPVLSALLA